MLVHCLAERQTAVFLAALTAEQRTVVFLVVRSVAVPVLRDAAVVYHRVQFVAIQITTANVHLAEDKDAFEAAHHIKYIRLTSKHNF